MFPAVNAFPINCPWGQKRWMRLRKGPFTLKNTVITVFSHGGVSMLCFPPWWSASDVSSSTSCKTVFLSLKVTPGTLLVESSALVVGAICKTIRTCRHSRNSRCGRLFVIQLVSVCERWFNSQKWFTSAEMEGVGFDSRFHLKGKVRSKWIFYSFSSHHFVIQGSFSNFQIFL